MRLVFQIPDMADATTGAWLPCHMAPDHMHTRRGALARIEREFAREVAAGR